MTLLLAESLTLAECEAVIERGLQTFVEVGNALLTIRDGRLYRAIAGTFEDYCRERWNMSRPRAYQLIDAAMTVNNLSTTVDILPTSERQSGGQAVDSPPDSPAGLYGNSLGYLRKHINHTWNSPPMVYWNIGDLKYLAPLEEIENGNL